MRSKKGSVDPEAYEDYLKGRYLWNKFTPEGLKKSVEFYRQALERDHSYAQAYAGLSESYEALMDLSVLPPAEVYSKSEAAARKVTPIQGFKTSSDMSAFRSSENQVVLESAEP